MSKQDTELIDRLLDDELKRLTQQSIRTARAVLPGLKGLIALEEGRARVLTLQIENKQKRIKELKQQLQTGEER